MSQTDTLAEASELIERLVDARVKAMSTAYSAAMTDMRTRLTCLTLMTEALRWSDPALMFTNATAINQYAGELLQWASVQETVIQQQGEAGQATKH
jgi:hypothetical protein